MSYVKHCDETVFIPDYQLLMLNYYNAYISDVFYCGNN